MMRGTQGAGDRPILVLEDQRTNCFNHKFSGASVVLTSAWGFLPGCSPSPQNPPPIPWPAELTLTITQHVHPSGAGLRSPTS
jgi:hypothetical protein